MALDLTRVRALVFDVDGTLADTDDHLVQQLAQALDAVPGVSGRRAEQLARRVVMSAETPVNTAYGLLDKLGLDDEFSRIKGAVADAKSRLRDIRRQRESASTSRNAEAADHVPHSMVPGVKEMLHTLATHYPMCTVSTGHQERVDFFLEHYEVRRLFRAVVTAQTTPRMKPYPDPILYAAEAMVVPPEDVLVIGDTTVDMEAATAAGAQAIGVLCGFGTEAELRASGASLICETTSDVLSVLLPADDPLEGESAVPHKDGS
ncbi:HAD family hydrolase [Rubricoccus marinus]|uniref:phosphoglycolate phosphatase n=1 Tax=Rubricoccus marinus TaxID=716817 RepID=A0A259TYJ3_9BACT|nr:HAD family hydrolase [Rubricoccus marinus]OZC02687.1 hypothetical protein BSZ36_06680 [Rubricoccus marinus]